MIKNIFIFGAVVLLASLISANFIFADKKSPEGAVRKYWQYLLKKDCQKMDEMTTDFTGYRRDEKGQIYQVQIETKQVGAQKTTSSSSCFLAEKIEAFVSKKDFKIIKSETDEELRVANVLISTKDHNKIERKFHFSLSKDLKDEIWKVVGFNMLVDEDK